MYPDYELLTLKAVQSNGNNNPSYADWFEALQSMEDAISDTDFDLAIIGCGAYGLPLAAHVKRLGKKAVHMGGGSQLLFGIRGRRWDDPLYLAREWPEMDGDYTTLFNEHWVRPGSSERPAGAEQIEGACYW